MESKYIVLLRGINVGGKRKIRMKDLKDLLVQNGYQNVLTYIQSGNIILQSLQKDIPKIENHISGLIQKAYSFEVPVMVLNNNQFLSIYNGNPFIENDIKSLHVTILKSPVAKVELNKEEAMLIDSQVYLLCPEGYSKTKYTNDFFEKRLKCKATTRNWKTMTALNDLLKSI